MTTQIEVKGNKQFDDVNRNNVNQGDLNRRKTTKTISRLNPLRKHNTLISTEIILIEKRNFFNCLQILQLSLSHVHSNIMK